MASLPDLPTIRASNAVDPLTSVLLHPRAGEPAAIQAPDQAQ